MKLSFLERIDPAIEHTAITASETRPSKDPKFAHNLDPARSWCTGAEQICIRSRYRLEGKLPAGVKLAYFVDAQGNPSECTPLPESARQPRQLIDAACSQFLAKAARTPATLNGTAVGVVRTAAVKFDTPK